MSFHPQPSPLSTSSFPSDSMENLSSAKLIFSSQKQKKMTGKSSSSKSKNVGSDSEKSKEPKMSGAYIRDLVKQLSSSRTRDPSNIKVHENLEREGMLRNRNLYRNTRDGFFDQRPEKSNQPYKKQVRRRLHTSKPYQERLLNMAEARREIVTALKFHRAAMKQASDTQQQQQSESRPETLPVGPASSHQLSLQEEEAKLKSRRNPRIYASNSDRFSYSQGFRSPYSWPGPPPPLIQENLNLTLPSQTLGLNLNLQEFYYSDSTTSLYSSSSASTSSSSPPSSITTTTTTTKEIPLVGPPKSVAADVVEFGDYGLHHAMDDKEMAEIRSIGEQYQMEWNDTLNLVNSAWWFEFLKAMEITSSGDRKGDNFFNYPFDEAVEFPPWLNADGSCMQQVHDLCSDSYSYLEDPAALPCMDIEEMDGGVDGEWLA
ncbi:hypothetical protein OROMI_031285 [Orobanche minor]